MYHESRQNFYIFSSTDLKIIFLVIILFYDKKIYKDFTFFIHDKSIIFIAIFLLYFPLSTYATGSSFVANLTFYLEKCCKPSKPVDEGLQDLREKQE